MQAAGSFNRPISLQPSGSGLRGRSAPLLRMRHALEVRHPSFCQPESIALLRRHDVAWAIANTAGRWPETGDVTSDFLYMRLHGAQELYAGGYTDAQIGTWARRISALAAGGGADMRQLSDGPAKPLPERNVLCFFDNAIKVKAPANAMRLAEALHLNAQLNIQR